MASDTDFQNASAAYIYSYLLCLDERGWASNLSIFFFLLSLSSFFYYYRFSLLLDEYFRFISCLSFLW
jgi:hypothetical protein